MTPFLLVYYGTDGSGGWQFVLHQQLRTITTVDQVRPSHSVRTPMRMLQPSELRKAMDMVSVS